MSTHEICSVPADGLCILKAFKECIDSVSGKLISMDNLKHRLRTEMSLCLCVRDEVDQFLENPLECYSRDICDMFLAALDNTFKESIKVFQSGCHNCWIFNLSDKQKRYNTTLYFTLYDASQVAFTCSKLTIETIEQGVKYAQS